MDSTFDRRSFFEGLLAFALIGEPVSDFKKVYSFFKKKSYLEKVLFKNSYDRGLPFLSWMGLQKGERRVFENYMGLVDNYEKRDVRFRVGSESVLLANWLNLVYRGREVGVYSDVVNFEGKEGIDVGDEVLFSGFALKNKGFSLKKGKKNYSYQRLEKIKEVYPASWGDVLYEELFGVRARVSSAKDHERRRKGIKKYLVEHLGGGYVKENIDERLLEGLERGFYRKGRKFLDSFVSLEFLNGWQRLMGAGFKAAFGSRFDRFYDKLVDEDFFEDDELMEVLGVVLQRDALRYRMFNRDITRTTLK